MKELIRHILREHTRDIGEARKPKYSNYDVNDESFARTFFHYINELPNNKDYSYNRVKKSLDYAIRLWTDKPHKIISKSVAEYFIENYPNANPFSVRWDHRKKYGVLGGKSLLVLEHTTPVNIFIKELLKCKSLDDVVRVMNEYTGVCLITREEDDCLNSKGLTSKRPDGWVIAYNSCGIEVMDESQFNTYKQQKLNSTEDETID
jgi:hypothetical protein